MGKNVVRIYGFIGNDCVFTTWYNYDMINDDYLETVARNAKATYGCENVYGMFDSKELRDSWLVYIKSRNLRNGLAEFAKFEFKDYVVSGDWELAKD